LGHAGFAIGLAIDTWASFASGNLGFWLPIGVVFGFALGTAMKGKPAPRE
jgi:hypothetical protein